MAYSQTLMSEGLISRPRFAWTTLTALWDRYFALTALTSPVRVTKDRSCLEEYRCTGVSTFDKTAWQYQSLYSLHARDLLAEPALDKSPCLTHQKRCLSSKFYSSCQKQFPAGVTGTKQQRDPPPTLPTL